MVPTEMPNVKEFIAGVERETTPTYTDKCAATGLQQNFGTGAVRDVQQGKGRFDLITPVGERRLARRYEHGANNYGDRNWEEGMPISRCIDSAKRHLNQYLAGDFSEDHLAAVAWNVFAAMHFEERVPQMQDIPTRRCPVESQPVTDSKR